MIPHALAAFSTGRWFAPKFGAWNTIAAGFIISALCTMGIPFMSTLNGLMITQAFNGFAQGLHLPLLMGLAIQTIDQDKRATAMGFYQAVYAIGMFGGPFFAGWINTHFNLAGGFYFGGWVGILAALLTFYWAQKDKKLQQINH
jgi:MFS family permease